MRTIKRALTTSAFLLMAIGAAKAQCPSQGTIHIQQATKLTATQLADAGKLCAAAPVIVYFPGTQHAIALSVLSTAPVKVEIAVGADPILGTPLWVNYAPPAIGVIGGLAEGQGFVLPAAIEALRVSVQADTSANVIVGVI
jgi:hypothetical protein